jgi:hypothetical protein
MDFQPFPTMIYHLIEGQKVVHSQEEMDSHFARGWTARPADLTEKGLLKAKIAQVEADLEQMKQNLAALENDEEPQTPARRGPGRPKRVTI